jgi:hypothetical protein
MTGVELIRFKLIKFHSTIGGYNYLANLKNKYNMKGLNPNLTVESVINQLKYTELFEEWRQINNNYPEITEVINTLVAMRLEEFEEKVTITKTLFQELFPDTLPQDAFETEKIGQFMVNGTKIVFTSPKEMFIFPLIGSPTVEARNQESWKKHTGYGETDHMFS